MSLLTRYNKTNISQLARSHNTVVTLLGWAGCKDAHLTKYSSIYEKKGLTTLNYIGPISIYQRFHGPNSMKNYHDLHGLIDNMRSVLSDPETKLVLHVFSMNGVCALCSLLLQYPELNIFERTSAVLFDSCPVYMDNDMIPTISQMTDVGFLQQNPKPSAYDYVKYKIWKIFRLMQIKKEMTERALYETNGGDMTKISQYHYLRDLPNLPYHLAFVYSDADSTCRADVISAFHEHLENTGRCVDVLHLPDTNHVDHLRKYPELYEGVIDRLLEPVFQKEKTTMNSKL